MSSTGADISDPTISTLLRLGLSEQDAHGWPLAPQDVQRRFEDLTIGELLGQGATGAVYRVVDPRTQRPYALKIISPALMSRPELVARFSREADAMQRLDHPAIAHVYDFGERDGLFYLRMEYVDGDNLRDATSPPVPAKVAVDVAIKLCEALQCAHALGVVHRDIKPENILLDRDGHVTLVDFGVAKLHRSDTPWTLTGANSVLGTPLYLAPEQIETPTLVDSRADLFSVGVVLYELLTGRLPIGRFIEPSRVVDVPRSLDAVVLRALAPDRERRFADAEAMQRALENSMRRGLVRTLARNRRRIAMSAALFASVGVAAAAADDQTEWFQWAQAEASASSDASPTEVEAKPAPTDDSVGAFMLAARDAEADERWGDAIAHYQAVLARNPAHASARYGLGHAAFRDGDHERAMDELYRYTQDHATERDIGRALYFGGLARTKLGHCRDAILYFAAVAKAQPADERLRTRASEQIAILQGHLDGSEPNPKLTCRSTPLLPDVRDRADPS